MSLFVRRVSAAIASASILAVATLPIAAAYAAGGRTIAANTEIPFKLSEELSSKVNKQGDRFNITVADDVMQNGQVIVPRGTSGVGEISLLVEKGAFGKSGKLETKLLYFTLNGKQIPLTGQRKDAGQGGTAGTVAVAVVAGVFSAFVTGKSAVLPAGTTLVGYTTDPVTY